MIVIGLTGSIAMGKSATAQMFRAAGLPVYDADAAVAALYAPGGGAADAIRALAPEAVTDAGGVDREALRQRALGDPAFLKRLEAAIHPLAARARTQFLTHAREQGARAVVLDVPLLFETGGEALCDVVVVVSAPAEIQRERALAREGMSESRLAAILARQTPDAEKRARADYVIDTGQGFDHARAQVAAILADVLEGGE